MNNKIVIEVFVAINNSRCRYPKHERSASKLLARANVTVAGTWNAVLMTAAMSAKQMVAEAIVWRGVAVRLVSPWLVSSFPAVGRVTDLGLQFNGYRRKSKIKRM